MQSKGWYIIPGLQDGDRTVGEQLTGLDRIVEVAHEHRYDVLDFGCAEGLISKHLVEQGAHSALGLSHVQQEIEVARKVSAGLPCRFEVCNLDDYRERRKELVSKQYFGIVLLLSILHKLKKPGDFLNLALRHATDFVAVRLPSPVIRDYRSEYRAFDVRPALSKEFELVETPRGPRDEWQTIWRRKK